MSKYFCISNGLRGCYMPDSCQHVRVDTRRELKEALEYEAEHLRESYKGASVRNVSRLAADAWREAQKEKPTYLDIALPLAPNGSRDYSYGLFVSVSTRSDFIDYLENEE